MSTRAARLERDLAKLLDSDLKDGSALLPPYASAEPGALLHEMHEVWTRQGGSGENAHSFAKLKEACRVNSLQHKLKGRLPIEGKDGGEDAQSLSRAMLRNWRADGSAFRPGLDPAEAAERIAQILFGPIYGLVRKEIRIVASPGVNAATFMREQRARARAIVIPVIDRAMFGPDPADTLDGTRLSVAQYLGDDPEPTLGAEEPSAAPAPMIIYALRSEPANITKDYVRYIYERSFLSTLFRLVQQTSEAGWNVEPVGKRLPPWVDLERRLWVCVSPADQRADDIIPVRVPENWKDVVEGGIGPAGEFGLAVVHGNDGTLEYWKYAKDRRAFSKIRRPADRRIEHAHMALIRAVFDVAGVGADGGGTGRRAEDPPGGVLRREEIQGEGVSLGTWTIASAEAFMRDRDLIDGAGGCAGSGR